MTVVIHFVKSLGDDVSHEVAETYDYVNHKPGLLIDEVLRCTWAFLVRGECHHDQTYGITVKSCSLLLSSLLLYLLLTEFPESMPQRLFITLLGILSLSLTRGAHLRVVMDQTVRAGLAVGRPYFWLAVSLVVGRIDARPTLPLDMSVVEVFYNLFYAVIVAAN